MESKKGALQCVRGVSCGDMKVLCLMRYWLQDGRIQNENRVEVKSLRRRRAEGETGTWVLGQATVWGNRIVDGSYYINTNGRWCHERWINHETSIVY